jgi:glycosyltransferase involved in cell wall biosynthesis
MHTWNDDRIFQRACCGLADEGMNIHLIACKEEDSIVNNVHIHAISKRSGIKRRIFSSRDAYKLLKKSKPDIVHFHDPDLLPWMLLLSIQGYKVVYDIHENYLARFEYLPSIPRKIASWVYKTFEHFCISRFSGIVVTTESMKNLYSKIHTHKLVVGNIPYLKALTHLNEDLKKDDKITIITSGTNSDARNCMQTVEAMPYVLKAFPNVQFKFAGNYHPSSMKENMRQKAEELGVSANLILEDNLPWLQNFKRVAKAHIGCVFYEDNLNNRVTIPNRLFEYMIGKLAIVGESFPEVSKTLLDADCGVSVNSSDPKNIAEGIISILQNPELMAQQSINGYNAVLNKYNFENSLKEQIIFYKKILEQ